MIIRSETADDYKEVYNLNYEAFGRRHDEAELVERIRQSEEFVPELSIVAELDGKLAGHVLLSKAAVFNENGKRQEVIVLAPIAVRPDMQKKGVGSQLITEGLKRSRALGYPAVLLIGHPSYYPKFGFKPARAFGLELHQYQVPDPVFMVCELNEGALQNLRGELRYPAAFSE
ncbi:N-acetyltransferase [Paenibacillus doosanensis]|uniref:N-acetyltransferase domain-containing protein n=1 Tax=Paenibacillus konkukensis TaxID=2020716 RepID=A0ABY4RY89_9BACL|nr:MULTISPECIES: N-acetyltransferase [Paenibacillus]MCS7463334.1 N-acetyltransferase [Paenibacillus doosanensis]UQZ87639.1 hypothetical protein SK3146_06941 [Paenibacillus konkukensis]